MEVEHDIQINYSWSRLTEWYSSMVQSENGIFSSSQNQVDDSKRKSHYFFFMVCRNVYSYHHTKCKPFINWDPLLDTTRHKYLLSL